MIIKILTLLTFFSICFSNSGESLNDRIYKCHKKKIKCCSHDIETQHKVREQYIGDIIRLRNTNPNDTIVLSESHSVICEGCPASVEVFTATKYQRFEINYDGNRYTKYTSEPIQTLKNFYSYDKNISGQYLHYDLKKILLEIRTGKSFEKIVAENNTEECVDGSITIYTIIFPNNKLDCMKIRCWNDGVN